MKFLQVKLPDDMHDNFKDKCTEKNTDMSNVVKKWIKNFLDKGE